MVPFTLVSDLDQLWLGLGLQLRVSSGLFQYWPTLLFVAIFGHQASLGCSQGPDSTMDRRGLQELHDICSVIRMNCWDTTGRSIIEMAVKAGFDITEVVDENVSSPWATRYDSRVGPRWPAVSDVVGKGCVGQPQVRTLQRSDTEEELVKIKRRQELYTAKKDLAQEMVQDANRNQFQASEMSRACVSVPKAPETHDRLLVAIQQLLPQAAVQKAESASAGVPTNQIHSNPTLVATALQAQQARMTPTSGQAVLCESQAPQGIQAVAEQAQQAHFIPLPNQELLCESQALQGMQAVPEQAQQAEILAESQAAQGIQAAAETNVVTPKMDPAVTDPGTGQARALQLDKLEAHRSEQLKELEARAETRALQNQEAHAQQMMEWEARAKAQSEQIKESRTRAEAQAMEQFQARDQLQATSLREFEARTEARVLQQAVEFQVRMKELEDQTEATTLKQAETHVMEMNRLEAQIKAKATEKAEAHAMHMKELEAQMEIQATEGVEAQVELELRSQESPSSSSSTNEP